MSTPAELISGGPRHPHLQQFPGKQCGNQIRRFNASWYESFSWLDYDSCSDVVFCYECRICVDLGIVNLDRCTEDTFCRQGFCQWKKAIQRFRGHQSSQFHLHCVTALASHKRGYSISTAILKGHDEQQAVNRQCLLKIISCIKFLARQGLALRGNEEMEGNFYQLLLLRSNDVPDLFNWLQRSKAFIHKDIQNEFIQLFCRELQHDIVMKVKSNSGKYGLLVDETADLSNVEQVSFSVRTVDQNYEVDEYLLGLASTAKMDAETLFLLIKDILTRVMLPLEDCRGQGYDGAATMSGSITGVQARVKQCNSSAHYSHCLMHSSALGTRDIVRSSTLLRTTIDLVGEIINFMRGSPKRLSQLQSVILNDCDAEDEKDAVPKVHRNTLRPLCPTRMTMQANSMASLLDNYKNVLELLDNLAAGNSDSASKAGGLSVRMEKFDFFFSLNLLHFVFDIIERLASAVQNPAVTMDAAVGAAELAVDKFKSVRTEEGYEYFWLSVLRKQVSAGVDVPKIPRLRKPPHRLDQGAHPVAYSDPKDYYRRIFFEAIDLAAVSLSERFHTEGVAILQKIENLLVASSTLRKEIGTLPEELQNSMQELCKNYPKDIDEPLLAKELTMLPNIVSKVNKLSDIKKKMLDPAIPLRQLLPNVHELLRLSCLIPVSTATSERSFSALRRTKTYLRSTMDQNRSCALVLLTTHRTLLDNVCDVSVAQQFVNAKPERKTVFGAFQ
jgi:hypothetical protein